MDFSGSLDVCIAIRLVSKRGTNLRIQSGAGIVADSVPEQEFKVCQYKARAVVLAIEEAKGGIGDDIAD